MSVQSAVPLAKGKPRFASEYVVDHTVTREEFLRLRAAAVDPRAQLCHAGSRGGSRRARGSSGASLGVPTSRGGGDP